MKDSTYLAAQLAGIHDDIDLAREDRSWQALAALRRQALALREAYTAALQAERRDGEGEEQLDPAEALEAVCAFIREAPESVLEELHAAFEERVRPPLALVEGEAAG